MPTGRASGKHLSKGLMKIHRSSWSPCWMTANGKAIQKLRTPSQGDKHKEGWSRLSRRPNLQSRLEAACSIVNQGRAAMPAARVVRSHEFVAPPTVLKSQRTKKTWLTIHVPGAKKRHLSASSAGMQCARCAIRARFGAATFNSSHLNEQDRLDVGTSPKDLNSRQRQVH